MNIGLSMHSIYPPGIQSMGMGLAMPSKHYYWQPSILSSATSPSADLVMHHSHQIQPSSNDYLILYVSMGIPTFHPRPSLVDQQGSGIFSYSPTQLVAHHGAMVSPSPEYVTQHISGFPTPSPWKCMIHNVKSPSAFSSVALQYPLHAPGGYFSEAVYLPPHMVFSPVAIQPFICHW